MVLLTKALKKRINNASAREVNELNDFVLNVWFEKMV